MLTWTADFSIFDDLAALIYGLDLWLTEIRILHFAGGFPNLESVSKRTQGRYFEPFKGCLQDIQFGAEPTAVISDFSAYQGENIGSCDLHGDEPIVV